MLSFAARNQKERNAYGSNVCNCESSILGEKKCPFRDSIRLMRTSLDPLTERTRELYFSVTALLVHHNTLNVLTIQEMRIELSMTLIQLHRLMRRTPQ